MLITTVLCEPGRAALVDWQTALLAISAAVVRGRFKLYAAWLVLGGGLIALLIRWLAPGLLP